MIKLISWNVNGLRAQEKKGFLDFFDSEKANIFCIQEVKAQLDQLSEKIKEIPGYEFYLNSAEKKGYSGVATYTDIKPISVREGLLDYEYNNEGRVLVLEFPQFYLYNVYFPNGCASDERRIFKNRFDLALVDEVTKLLEQDKGVIICGDVNIAHEEIDLYKPDTKTSSGFRPEERAVITKLLDNGYVDSFRKLNPDTVKYSWWNYRGNMRATNSGWRIDYFFISENLVPFIEKADIMVDVFGSDHAPILLELNL